MRFELAPHPSHRHGPAYKLWASAERSAAFGKTATLNLWFGINAPTARFVVPPVSPEASRRDNLWRSTCFECFLKTEGEEAYREWNFSPSGDWAAYDFTGEREGMETAEVASPPYIRTEDNLTWWGLGATLAIPANPRFTIALSAIVEELGGERFFFALHHPSEQPDFHHPDCFTARLA